MKKILTLLAAALTLFSCQEKTPTEPAIRVTSGSTNQTVYADQTTSATDQQVKFATQGPWRAEVSEATKAESAVDWVTLSQTSGDAAGEYTLDITLSVNYTGADRTAVIRIICGESVITITIVQKGVTESGEAPVPDPGADKAVTEIISYGSAAAGTIDSHVWFENDAQGRITKVTYSDAEEPEPRVQQVFVYGVDTLTMTMYDYETYVDSDGNYATKAVATTTAYLMSNGRLTEEVPSEPNVPLSTWTYNAAGYLTRYVQPGAYTESSLSPEGDSTITTTTYYTTNFDYTWENGCPVKVSTTSNLSTSEPDDWTATSEFTTQPSGVSNMDMFSALLESGDWGMIYGSAGLKSSFLPSKSLFTPSSGEQQTATFRYEFDSEGSVTKVYRNLDGAGEALLMELVY